MERIYRDFFRNTDLRDGTDLSGFFSEHGFKGWNGFIGIFWHTDLRDGTDL